MNKAAIILAAGAGTRMKSALPKVLHKVAGLPMLGHAIAALRGAGIARIVVVTSAAGEAVRAYAAALGCETAIQQQQLGTGHAAAAAKDALHDFDGTIVIASGDVPLITPAIITDVLAAQGQTGLALAAFEAANPGSYGRVLTAPDGTLDRIIEFKDASEEQRNVTLCNAGLYAVDARKFFGWTGALKNNNAQGEYYLTDIPAIARQAGIATAIARTEEAALTGVNSRAELAAAEALMQARLRRAFLEAGVGMAAPDTVHFSHDTQLGADTQIEPYVVFGLGVTVAGGVTIRAFSHIEGARIATGAIIGPYARLRPGADIGEDAHVGNFVEVKNTQLGKGAKANHLTYLGDASVGAKANIGAGTITCNYDGFTKARTVIGAGAFIGSDTALVAPVTVGDGAITAAGSVITTDVDADALAIARGTQTQKRGWAAAFRASKTRDKK